MIASVALSRVADVNPRTATSGLLATDMADFFPMAAVDADQTVAHSSERRALGEVSSGFTNFRDGDILVAKITPCFENGKIAQAVVTTGAGFGSTEFHVVRCGADLDGRYLVHFLRRPEVRLDGQRKMTGSAGQRRVPKHFLESLEIPLPSLAEQRRIAAILDKADALRTKRREALAQLDQLAQAIFVDMFGDPIQNPRQWPTETLSSKFDFKNGINFSAEQKGRGILTVDVANMYSEDIYIRTDTLYRVDTSVSDDRLLVAGDLLFVRSSVKAEGVAWPALFAGKDEPVTYCGFLIRARPRTVVDEFNPKYMVYFLRQSAVRSQLVARAGKVAITNINQERLGSLEVAKPPIRLQEEFAARIERIEELRRMHLRALDDHHSLFAGLQTRAFCGEL